MSSGDLEAAIGNMSPQWSERHLGMQSRRILATHEHVHDLASAALDDALTQAKWVRTSVDAVVCGCTFVEQVIPPTASYLARGTNPQAIAFDVNAACASFVYALATTAGLMTSGIGIDRAAVCVAERPTAWADYRDPRSSIFWGDSAGAVLVTRDEPTQAHFRIDDLELNGLHDQPEKVLVPMGGTFRSDGHLSYNRVVQLCGEASTAVLQRQNVDPATVAGLVVHQANDRLIREVAAGIGVPDTALWNNFHWAGNQAGAGLLTAFSAGSDQHCDDLADGDHVVLTAVGGGYSGGALLLTWSTGTGG